MRILALLLAAGCGDNLAIERDASASDGMVDPDAAPPDATVERVSTNLLALWNFDDGAGAVIKDAQGLQDLLIADHTKVIWTPGAMEIVDFTVITNPPLPPALDEKNPIDLAIRASGQYTVEVWAMTSALGQDGSALGMPAWVLTLANRANARDLGIGQAGLEWVATSRNQPGTDPQGLPAFRGGAVTVDPTHLVLTADGDGRHFYVDGELVGEDAIGGPLDDWNIRYRTNLGGEPQGTNAWRGTYYLVAIYDRLLSVDEIQRNLAAGF